MSRDLGEEDQQIIRHAHLSFSHFCGRSEEKHNVRRRLTYTSRKSSALQVAFIGLQRSSYSAVRRWFSSGEGLFFSLCLANLPFAICKMDYDPMVMDTEAVGPSVKITEV